MNNDGIIAPNCAGLNIGVFPRKPWHYKVTAAIAHLETVEPLIAAIECLRCQTERPYILVIDTGSCEATRTELEKLRAPDLEIHYVRGHAYEHSSEPVTVALDLAQSLCATKYLFHTHADCFLMRNDLIEDWMRICNANTPVVGYRMSPRQWVSNEWELCVGHTVMLSYMPSIHRAGATWSIRRSDAQFGYGMRSMGGWPDTETGWNFAIREAGIIPIFLGFDENHKRQTDSNMDHVRSYTGTKFYDPNGKYNMDLSGWMKDALADARKRVARWRGLCQ